MRKKALVGSLSLSQLKYENTPAAIAGEFVVTGLTYQASLPALRIIAALICLGLRWNSDSWGYQNAGFQREH